MTDRVRCTLCGELVPRIRNNCRNRCDDRDCGHCRSGEFVCGLCFLKLQENKTIRILLMERRREKLDEVRDIERRLGLDPLDETWMYV